MPDIWRTDLRLLFIALMSMCVSMGCTDKLTPELAWPEVRAEHKPWGYWHWMGSAVNKKGLTRHLEAYQQAGLGGMHIIPIYGVRGEEERFVEYLSDGWLEMLAHTVSEADRLGMGIDMSTGTGWPPGGPNVGIDDATAAVELKTYELSTGERLAEPIRLRDERTDRDAPLHVLMGFSDDGRILELTQRLDAQRRLDWMPSEGIWRLYAVFQVLGGKQVERAAPGGAGYIVDPFSSGAMRHYLARFDNAFARYRGKMPRAQYHDSYEYGRATWTDDFFEQFAKRRGYDLRRHLPALMGEGDAQTIARVTCDYRETLSDLHLDYIQAWVRWSHDKRFLTRNEAHGSPSNLLDTYAAADIPETEIFGPSGFVIPGLRMDPDFDFHSELNNPLALKFSSSAAHVAGHSLVSSETCTWLGEHFRVALSQAKPEIDQLFAAGINHIFYHGITYSPFDYPWPGWLFYASVHFCPANSVWRDLPALNAYITRCQSILQSGKPANDILLYWPVCDVWHNKGGMMARFGVHNLGDWLYGGGFHEAAKLLWERGYTFDYISGCQLSQVAVRQGHLQTGGARYRVVMVPKCRFMPLSTLEKLVALAKAGATVIVHGGLPEDVPGLGTLDERRQLFQKIIAGLNFAESKEGGIEEAVLGKGKFILGDNVHDLLRIAGIRREPIVDYGIEFIRRTHDKGYHYFLTNLGKGHLDGWVRLGVKANSAVMLDPLMGKSGLAAIRQANKDTEVYLQLEPGQSCILRTFSSEAAGGARWRYLKDGGEPNEIRGKWQVDFVEGGPHLPSPFETRTLTSWTELGDEEAKRFAGTATYSVTFDKPPAKADDWVLDLGRVCESARVRINGQNVGTLFSIPFKTPVGRFLRDGQNKLEVEVTNLSANRIRNLDRRGVDWKKFYEINFVNIDYEKFDASEWALMDSGLLGPVRLIPQQFSEP